MSDKSMNDIVKDSKTVTILAASDDVLVATNATERAVWKKSGSNSYVFSHVEKTNPTLSQAEFIDLLATDQEAKNG